MIDLLASEPQYAAHLDPVWAALPDQLGGERLERRSSKANDAVLVSAGADLAAARRLGYERIAYLEHGIGQSYGNDHNGYPGGRGRGAVGLFLSPNETAAARDRAAYPAARVEVVGDPRLDTLPAFRAERGAVALSFHWDCHVAPESRSAFLHYKPAIAALAASVPLIAHAHPSSLDRHEGFYQKLGVEFMPSFDEVCRRASLYVCDNSSTIYEFASTGRPVVVLNAPWFRRSVHHGLRFWAAADVGLNVYEPADLVRVVKIALADYPAQRSHREDALRIAYAYRTGAGARAAAAIVDWLSERQRAAA